MDILDFKDNYLIYSNKGTLSKVSYEDLLVIESDKPFVWFYLKKTKFLIQCSLVLVAKSLKNYFVQINRQVIVNMKYVECIVFEQASYWVKMKTGVMYRISERREKKVRNSFRLYA